MTAMPVALNGESIIALVVGGGTVATRKAFALLDAGAHVRVIAPQVSDELLRRDHADTQLVIAQREYRGSSDIANANLVVAATASRDINAEVAADAHQAHRMVNVVDAPASGTFTTMAVHRAGDVTIGVTTGSLPSAAVRIRDIIASRIDDRYATVISECTRVRSRMLAANGDQQAASNGQRDEPASDWATLQSTLITENFCEQVEDGSLLRALVLSK